MSVASRPLLRTLNRKYSRIGHFVIRGRQYASSSSPAPNLLTSRRRFGTYVSGGLLTLLGLGTYPFLTTRVHADTEVDVKRQTDTSTMSSLIRTYVVYSMCSVPALVDAAPKILSVLTSIPLVREVTEAFVRITFFDQFVGGDTAHETVPLLRTLRSANKGALFAYSIEVDESEATASSSSSSYKKGQPVHKRIVDEMVRCIDVAADFEDGIVGNAQTGRRTWVAVKMTALLPDAQSLINLSSYLLTSRKPLPVPFPGCPRSTDLDVLYNEKPSSGGTLTPDDVSSLRELHSDLRRICARAQQRGVKIIIDAEYSWYQPAIDAMQLSLMREFNKCSQEGSVQPLIYGTYQAYLRRTPSHLQQSFIDAKENNYTLGVKLVRGAYHPHEIAAYEARSAGRSSLSISPDSHPPVWSLKNETDACYNECAKVLIQNIKEDVQAQTRAQTSSMNPVKWFRYPSHSYPQIGVLFGTHNWESSRLILKELVDTGLAKEEEGGVVNLGDEVTERLTLGQLYGMSDELSNYLVQKTRSNAPMVIKYVPYGALSEVMPYLSRRAIENKSVLGNGTASEERKRAWKEIQTRIFG